MSNYWKSFFENYRLVDVKDDSDLRFQVGKSVGGTVISDDVFQTIIDKIGKTLNIQPDDSLLDLACGNGVITYEISKRCKKTIGIDFSSPYIENAKKFKSADNIKYYCDDILNFSNIIKSNEFTPNKILMQGVLAYLTPEQFDELLIHLRGHSSKLESFVVSAVPDKDRRHIFHNTLKRKLEWIFYSLILKKDKGVGRWYSKKEITEICVKNGFDVSFDQDVSGLNYRMDFVITPMK